MTAAGTTLTPFLMFEGAATEAMDFYISLFDDGEILTVTPHQGEQTGIQLAEFRVAGQRLLCSDSPCRVSGLDGNTLVSQRRRRDTLPVVPRIAWPKESMRR